MTLIKSISGIRGTIGGEPGSGLTPADIVKYTSAYAMFLREQRGDGHLKIVLGRDARISGRMVEQIVCGTLAGMGVDIINLGLAATPTVEIAVGEEKADGGIILTASHNPGDWNALKLLDADGEFISGEAGRRILEIAGSGPIRYVSAENTGRMDNHEGYNRIHIDKILALDLVKKASIEEAGFRVAVDCVNSVGGLVLPELLRSLGVKEVIELNCEPTGIFPHDPEPLPENLKDLAGTVRKHKADIGFAVDPDVDRLAIIDENGNMFGEEYTLVAVADFVLSNKPGNTVSNLSSSSALKDVTEKYGCSYYASAVGEVNVVAAMKENRAVIGGEGNGGVIYPPLHYGRDALTGVALFLSYQADRKQKTSQLRKALPEYHIVKNKISLDDDTDMESLLDRVRENYKSYPIHAGDGLKIETDEGWIHIRKSNTEAVIRIYTESSTQQKARKLADEISALIRLF